MYRRILTTQPPIHFSSAFLDKSSRTADQSKFISDTSYKIPLLMAAHKIENEINTTRKNAIKFSSQKISLKQISQE
jgi:hypothetical protein